MDWSKLYPNYSDDRKVEFADIGCGYGGLLVSLAQIYPETRMLGMEIRHKVTEYVRERILALREQSRVAEASITYENIAVIRANAMKFLPNFFTKGQLSKIFFLFPDPHFKRKKHKARIISNTLLSEYAYALRVGGLVYIATDVPELFDWMSSHLEAHPLFELVPKSSLSDDPVIPCVLNKTEEGLKVVREGRQKYMAVFRRI